MNNATIFTDTMSDGSEACNVRFRNDEGRDVAVLAAEDLQHAQRIADAINGAAWIQFHPTA